MWRAGGKAWRFVSSSRARASGRGEALRGRALSSAVVVTGADGYRAVFGIAEFDPAFTDRVAILADRKDDAPLPANAAPFNSSSPASSARHGGCAR